MNYLSIDQVSKSYGEKVLFEGISFGLNKGEKTALVANNGAGKSTLLRIIMNQEASDSGVVTTRKGISVSMLPQDPEFDKTLTVNDVVATANSGLIEIINNYHSCVSDFTCEQTPEIQKRLDNATSKMDISNAWDYERRLTQLLERFRINDKEQLIGKMSGGQIKRLSLALALLDEPDLLLLDEPTNHLDIDMIEWLEKYLEESKSTLLMVTHDRYFLDRVCNNIIELTDGEIFHHRGNYSYYLEKKSNREEVGRIEIGKAQKLMKKELEWIRRMPKARTTKSKARIDSFHTVKEKATSTKVKEEMRLGVNMTRIGNKILEMHDVSKSFDEIVILDKFDYTFKRGERIGFVGGNGTGKSTFLNLITKAILPDKGEINTGETIVYGHYKQEGIVIDESQTVLDVVKEIAEIIPGAKGRSLTASQFLNNFMFPPKVQNDYVYKLSGGEKRRLYLLTVLIKNPNFLILDEPTNDLDLLTLNKLEDFLDSYGGCLILVSHDRYFLDRLVDHLFVFNGNGKIKDYHSNYTEYRNIVNDELRKKKQQEASVKKENLKPVKKAPSKRKLSFKERNEYDGLMPEIDSLEKEKVELETKVNSGELGYEELSVSAERIGDLIKIIDEKTYRWMELDEIENG